MRRGGLDKTVRWILVDIGSNQLKRYFYYIEIDFLILNNGIRIDFQMTGNGWTDDLWLT